MPSIPLFTFQKSNKKGTQMTMYKIEATIDNLYPNFFNTMQDNDYYLTDSNDNYIVLEHSKNKSKIRIYETKAGYFYADFRNGLDIGYFAVDMFLGQIEDLSIKPILDTIHDKDFQDFCKGSDLEDNDGDSDLVDNNGGNDLEGKIFKIEPITYSNPTQHKIIDICVEMAHLLLYKNDKYGNSALEPKKIFFKGDNVTSILIRLDDKLSRIINNNSEIRTNDIADIIGYLVLLLIAKGVTVSELEKLKD